MGVDDTVARRDMSAIGVKGQAKVGFRCRDIHEAIRRTLGFGREVRAVLVGAGRLGGAIAAYGGFADYGLRLIAVFDSSPVRIWEMVGGLPIRPVDELGTFLTGNPVEIGIIAVPAPAAQEIGTRLTASGVRAIWNFAPTHLRLPAEVLVRTELMSVGLSVILHHLLLQEQGGQGRPGTD
jgi:redox-sensing transcriptional repressor